LNKFPKFICYTLDLEEDHAGYLQGFYHGLDHLESFLNKCEEKKIQLSIFVQARLCETQSEKMELLKTKKIDVHLHSYTHSFGLLNDIKKKTNEIELAVNSYSNFFNKPPTGFRFPLGILHEEDYDLLESYDIKFDSSIFPIIRPGYFNNLDKPLVPFRVNQIIEFPFSVISTFMRIPISLSYIKLFYPLHFMRGYSLSPIIFDFHLHDLYPLESTHSLSYLRKLPYCRMKTKGEELFFHFHDKLLTEGYHSITISKLYNYFQDECS